jgi:chromosomal replication initiation ATPase DnaA
LIKRNNMREYSEARQTIMYLALEQNLTLWYIGAYLDWRDHSTVSHGRESVEGTLLKDRHYLKKFNEVKNKLKTGIEVEVEQAETIKDLQLLR